MRQGLRGGGIPMGSFSPPYSVASLMKGMNGLLGQALRFIVIYKVVYKSPWFCEFRAIEIVWV
ncbi:hypothetical protein [Pseudomonas sp. REB1044]|uniref:hypothetical protein n=1 Tax=Pseudomonas sp. REB1044 TaxID=2675224 RepID=UPI00315D3350